MMVKTIYHLQYIFSWDCEVEGEKMDLYSKSMVNDISIIMENKSRKWKEFLIKI